MATENEKKLVEVQTLDGTRLGTPCGPSGGSTRESQEADTIDAHVAYERSIGRRCDCEHCDARRAK